MSIHKDYRCAECGGELVNLEREARDFDFGWAETVKRLYRCDACRVTYRIKEWVDGEQQHISVSVEERS